MPGRYLDKDVSIVKISTPLKPSTSIKKLLKISISMKYRINWNLAYRTPLLELTRLANPTIQSVENTINHLYNDPSLATGNKLQSPAAS